VPDNVEDLLAWRAAELEKEFNEGIGSSPEKLTAAATSLNAVAIQEHHLFKTTKSNKDGGILRRDLQALIMTVNRKVAAAKEKLEAGKEAGALGENWAIVQLHKLCTAEATRPGARQDTREWALLVDDVTCTLHQAVGLVDAKLRSHKQTSEQRSLEASPKTDLQASGEKTSDLAFRACEAELTRQCVANAELRREVQVLTKELHRRGDAAEDLRATRRVNKDLEHQVARWQDLAEERQRALADGASELQDVRKQLDESIRANKDLEAQVAHWKGIAEERQRALDSFASPFAADAGQKPAAQTPARQGYLGGAWKRITAFMPGWEASEVDGVSDGNKRRRIDFTPSPTGK